MKFLEELERGKAGLNVGIPLGPGLLKLSNAINGLQKGRYYVIASSPKVGKSTFMNYGFIIQPYLYALEHNKRIKWYYYSLEMDRVDQEYNFATYFLFHDYGITDITLDIGITVDGKNTMPLTPNYLRGRVMDDKGKFIMIKPKIEEALKKVYKNRIIPLFGEYDEEDQLIKQGLITVIETRHHPTGIYYDLLEEAKKYGKLKKKTYGTSERIIGYVPDDPEQMVIVCFDHCRKAIPERGQDEKKMVDTLSDYFVALRNLLGWSFVNVVHLNRKLGETDNLKFSKENIYPDSEKIMSSSSMAQDCDYAITLFNPNDKKYHLKKHFGVEIKDRDDNEYYPEMRTVHLVESRHCVFPQHFRVNMKGAYKNFEMLEI